MNNTYLGATSFLVQPTGTFKTPEQIAKEQAEAEKKRQQEEAARKAGEKTFSFFENLFRKKPETAPQGAALIEAPAPLQPKSKIPNLVIVLGAVAVVGTIMYLTKKK